MGHVGQLYSESDEADTLVFLGDFQTVVGAVMAQGCCLIIQGWSAISQSRHILNMTINSLNHTCAEYDLNKMLIILAIK